ncbi:hypothetical protein SBA6_470060 [Candidatus Sulfopaludibacter sp. SbA6]|nr:hypothetical protein SBA6_470060 [Candidatus Sulfopaludibacter sp. SbA6]
MKRKLIEVALPLEAINKESARKSQLQFALEIGDANETHHSKL